MTHGDEQAKRKHRDYIRTEAMAVAERISAVEGKLREVIQRLDDLEARLTGVEFKGQPY